ncbi:STAS domain-containing protein [Streptomyces sp. NPDC012888]|uniref:STAS domain-containing protein n=1 Tax=Streptomyces sp. NPDC012888 TaxID=3364855 RepID=UPI00367B441C
MEQEFRVRVRNYGPTVHVTAAGELDHEAGAAFAPAVEALVPGTTVVVWDMRHVTFMDCAGLGHLLDFQSLAEGRGTAVFTYDWQSGPLRLLELVDRLPLPPPGRAGDRTAASRLLRRTLSGRAGAQRDRGAGTVVRRGAGPVRRCRPAAGRVA